MRKTGSEASRAVCRSPNPTNLYEDTLPRDSKRSAITVGKVVFSFCIDLMSNCCLYSGIMANCSLSKNFFPSNSAFSQWLLAFPSQPVIPGRFWEQSLVKRPQRSTAVGRIALLLRGDTLALPELSAGHRNLWRNLRWFLLDGLQLQWEGLVHVDKRSPGRFCSSDGAQEPFHWWRRAKACFLSKVQIPEPAKYISRVRKSLLKYETVLEA